MMVLVPKINHKQTKLNARKVLKQTRKLARIAGRPIVDLKSPVITDMPRGANQDNMIELTIVNRTTADDELKAIEKALASLCFLNRQILYYAYCDVEYHSNYEIGLLVGGYSEKNIERLKSNALVEFAEAYKNGELLRYE